jgi:hypothetical protein
MSEDTTNCMIVLVMGKNFIILSNGRTGSSWLETSLNKLPDVVARHEVKWRPFGYDAQDVHTVLNNEEDLLRPVLESLRDETSKNVGCEILSAGTKLTYDHHNFISLEAIPMIQQCLGADMRIVHLRRSYMEIFLSWNARGVYHVINKDHNKSNDGNYDKSFVEAVNKLQRKGANINCINIVNLPAQYEENTLSREYDCIDINFFLAVEKILLYFYYDLFSVELMRNFKNIMSLQYQDIGSDLAVVASFIGSKAEDKQVQEILEVPLVSKLSELSPNLINPRVFFINLCTILDRTISKQVIEKKPISDIWEWNEDYSRAQIKIPEIQELLAPPLQSNCMKIKRLVWNKWQSSYYLTPQHTVV